MGLFGKKEKPQPRSLQPEAPPRLTEADLTDAALLMDRWDAVLGDSDATWACLEMIAHRGGFRGNVAAMEEVMDGKSPRDVTQRPWRWWNAAAHLAQASGNDALAGRIFLFTQLFITQILPTMRFQDMMLTGLEAPAPETSRSIATAAVGSLVRLSPGLLIHNSATGKVDVANALRMAEAVAGITAPQAAPPQPELRQSPPNAAGPFNRL